MIPIPLGTIFFSSIKNKDRLYIWLVEPNQYLFKVRNSYSKGRDALNAYQ